MSPISTAIIRYGFSISLTVFTLLCSLSVPAKEPSLDNDSAPYGLPKIELSQNSFTVNNEPFRFIGANAVNLIFYDDFDLSIEKAIKDARDNKISVLRIYMDWGWDKPEDYDKILDIASRHQVYIIVTFVDFQSQGEYLSKEGHFKRHSTYRDFLNPQTKRRFKRHIKQVIMRKNSINEKIYRDDTTIFAWDIGNELEYSSFNRSDVKKWMQEMATYIKTLDANHLVTIGIDTSNLEFDLDGPSYNLFNITGLDFFSFHFYPNPVDQDSTFLKKTYKEKIAFRTKKFLSMGKPVILEEFDFSTSGELNTRTRRNPQTKELYCDVIKNSMDAAFSSGAAGAMFWGWGTEEARNVPMWWSAEEHSIEDKDFLELIKEYKIPTPDT